MNNLSLNSNAKQSEKMIFHDQSSNSNKKNDKTLDWYGLLQYEDVIDNIISDFSIKEIMNFEKVIKGHEKVTELAWRRFRVKNHFYFDWAACQNEINRQKWNYYLSAALIKYINSDPIKKSIIEARKVQKRFGALIARFPSWGSYIQIDILKASSLDPNIPPKWQNQKAIILEKAIEGNWGGELFMQGLFEIKDYFALPIDKELDKERLSLIQEYLELAIEHEATYASLIALKFLRDKPEVNINKLASQAADKKDFRAWEEMAKKLSHKDLVKKKIDGYSYPSILAHLADYELEALDDLTDPKAKNQKIDQIKDLILDAVKGYRSSVPQWFIKVILAVADLKKGQEKWEDADRLMDIAIYAYGKDVPVNVLFRGIAIKEQLAGKDKEIDKLSDRILINLNTIELDFVCQTIKRKLLLKKNEEAQKLCNQLMAIRVKDLLSKIENDNKFVENLIDISQLGCCFPLTISQPLTQQYRNKINRYSEDKDKKVNQIKQLILNTFHNGSSSSFAAFILEFEEDFFETWKEDKAKWEDANKLIDRALDFFGQEAPREALFKAIKIKERLVGKEKEIDKLSDQLLVDTKTIPTEFWCNAIKRKLLLKKNEEAQKLCNQLMATREKHLVEALPYAEYDLLKTFIQLHQTGYCFPPVFLARLVECWLHKISWLRSQDKIEQLEHIKTFILTITKDKSFIAPQWFIDVILRIVELEKEEDKWNDADQLMDLAIRFYGQEVPKDTLFEAIKIKENLTEKEKEIDELSDQLLVDIKTIPMDFLCKAIKRKFLLKKHDEAQKLCNQLIVTHDKELLLDIKHRRNSFNELIELYRVGCSFPLAISVPLAESWMDEIQWSSNFEDKSKQVDQIKLLILHNIQTMQNDSFNLLSSTSETLSKFVSCRQNENKVEEIDLFVNQILNLYGNNIPEKIISWVIDAKHQINKTDEANQILDAFLVDLRDISTDFLRYAIWKKNCISTRDDIENFCERTFLAYGENIPFELLNKLAYTMYSNFNYKKAEKYYDQLIILACEKTPSDALIYNARIKECLEKFEEAEKYYSQAIISHGKKPIHFLEYAVEFMIKINKVCKANDLCNQFVNSYGNEHMKVDNLISLAKIKKKLNKFEEAISFCDQAVAASEKNSSWVLKEAEKIKQSIK